MKINYLIGLAAITLIVGCSKSEVVQRENPDSNNAIAFSTYAKQTKGTTFDNATFAADGREFGVTAFVSTAGYNTPYMGATGKGAQIHYTGTTSTWDYQIPAESRFWPASPATLTFYGYTPFASANRVGATLAFDKTAGMTFTDYVVSSDVAMQDDFMWARVADKGVASPAVAVPMNFGHALVRVNFKAQTTSDNLKVDIEANGITLGNIESKGTFVVAPTGVPSWNKVVGNRLKYTIPSVEKTGIENTTAVDVSKTTAADAVMLMPQEITAWVPSTATPTESTKAEGTSQTGGYIKVMCKIYTLSADASPAKLYLHGNATEYKPIYIPLSSQSAPSTEIWKANNNITYTLQFGGGYSNDGNKILNPIQFTTTVTGWIDIAGGDLQM